MIEDIVLAATEFHLVNDRLKKLDPPHLTILSWVKNNKRAPMYADFKGNVYFKEVCDEALTLPRDKRGFVYRVAESNEKGKDHSKGYMKFSEEIKDASEQSKDILISTLNRFLPVDCYLRYEKK